MKTAIIFLAGATICLVVTMTMCEVAYREREAQVRELRLKCDSLQDEIRDRDLTITEI